MFDSDTCQTCHSVLQHKNRIAQFTEALKEQEAIIEAKSNQTQQLEKKILQTESELVATQSQIQSLEVFFEIFLFGLRRQ